MNEIGKIVVWLVLLPFRLFCMIKNKLKRKPKEEVIHVIPTYEKEEQQKANSVRDMNDWLPQYNTHSHSASSYWTRACTAVMIPFNSWNNLQQTINTRSKKCTRTKNRHSTHRQSRSIQLKDNQQKGISTKK